MAIQKNIPLPDIGNGNKPAQKPDTKQDAMLNELIPENTKAQVTTTAKFEVDKTQTPKRQTNQIPFNAFANQQQQTVSDNPILDFISYWKEETDFDLYVLLTRLPDNPLVQNEFTRPCGHSMTFAPFPFNPASFFNDVVKVNGNSGGYFKVIMVDENTEQIDGDILKRVAFANPLTAPVTNENGNDNNSILKFLEASEKRQMEFMQKILEPKQDKFGQVAETYFMKKLTDIDKPQENHNNGLSGLPPETQALVSLMQNPQVTKTAMTQIATSISTLFSNDEKTAETVKTATGWLDRLINVYAENPELQAQSMTLLNKVTDIIGFGLSKIGQTKAQQPRPPRPNQQQQRAAQTNTANTPPVNNPNNTEHHAPESYIDVEANDITDLPNVDVTNVDDFEMVDLTPERIAAENETINSEIFQSILKYIESDETLTLDNEFMTIARNADKMRFSLAVAMFKNQTFEETVNYILNDYPFIEDFLNGRLTDENADWSKELGEKRTARLREFHALLVAGTVAV